MDKRPSFFSFDVKDKTWRLWEKSKQIELVSETGLPMQTN